MALRWRDRCTVACTLLCLISGRADASSTLKIRSDLPNQAVYIDGVDVGLMTPADVAGLPSGLHEVRVVGGCRVGQALIDVPPAGVAEIDVQTVEVPATLTIQVSPPSATVRLDGAAVETPVSDLALSCGSHSLSVAAEGHLPVLITLDVEAGEALELPVTLTPVGAGTVSVQVLPAEARLVLDGADVGVGSLDQLRVTAGPHLLQASAAGYASLERPFVLEDGASLDLRLELESEGEREQMAASVGAAVPRTRQGRPRWVGWSVTAGGVGLGALTAAQAVRMFAMGREYERRAADVLATNDASLLAPSYAQQYRQDVLLPKRNQVVLMSVGTAMMVGTGVVLTQTF